MRKYKRYWDCFKKDNKVDKVEDTEIKESNKWKLDDNEVKNLEAKECSFIKKSDKIITLSEKVYKASRVLCKLIKIEWQMLLIGKITDTEIIIEDYIIPKQRVSFSYVENDECIDQLYIDENNIIGTMHSHGSMNVFFSSTDDEANMCLIKYHIVTNNNDEYIAGEQVVLPCGLKKVVDIDVEIENDLEVKGFENIKIENNIVKSYKHEQENDLFSYNGRY